MPKLLTNANHDIVLNLSCDCGVCILKTHEARIVKNECGRPKKYSPIKV